MQAWVRRAQVDGRLGVLAGLAEVTDPGVGLGNQLQRLDGRRGQL